MDISAEIAAIQAASQGSELRQPLVGALNKLNTGTLPAVTTSDAGKILKVGANGWEVGEKSGYMPVPVSSLNISSNNTYDVTNYSEAVVNVPQNEITQADNGKVVVNGELVTQTARSSEITSNGVYDTTINNSVTINVSGASHSLPSIYQEVEYIQVSGTQYCTIDFKIYTDDRIYSKTMCTSHSGDEQGFAGIFYSGRFWELYYGSNLQSEGITSYPPLTSSSEYKMVNISGDGPTTTNVINELLAEFKAVASAGTVQTFYVGLYRTDRYPFTGRIYRFSIYRNGNTVLDLVPCYRKNDSAVGFFDIVRQVFYTNVGSGQFIAGNDS